MEGPVNVGKLEFQAGQEPDGFKLQEYSMSDDMLAGLCFQPPIIYGPNETRDERIKHDPNLKKRYLKRPVEASDSLQTIGEYHLLDPATDAQVFYLPRDDEESRRILKEKGFPEKDIQNQIDGKQVIINYYKAGYETELSKLPRKQRSNPAILMQLQQKYLELDKFPVCRVGITDRAPPLNMSDDRTHYALATLIPQDLDNLLKKNYIGAMMNYFFFCLRNDHGIEAIDTETVLYYDYHLTSTGVLYFFFNLTRH